MSDRSNSVKSKQLGIPHGTAQHQLRKSIMFMLIQKCGMDNCFKCGEKILSSDELSIEHKQPWLHVSNDLFWDLDNIAFSHMKCNRPDRTPHKKVGPDGTAWCKVCRIFLTIDNFPKDKRAWDGISKECTKCNTVKKARYRNSKK